MCLCVYGGTFGPVLAYIIFTEICSRVNYDGFVGAWVVLVGLGHVD